MKQPTRRSPEKKPAAKAKRPSREELNAASRERKREKKHRGHPSGSRANPVVSSQNSGGSVKSVDPRLGSKKPVALGENNTTLKPAEEKQAKKVVVSPAEELAMLESDQQLDALLDRLERGDELSAEEQAWLDKTLDRIEALMNQLGIVLDDDTEDEEAEEDMYRLLKGGAADPS